VVRRFARAVFLRRNSALCHSCGVHCCGSRHCRGGRPRGAGAGHALSQHPTAPSWGWVGIPFLLSLCLFLPPTLGHPSIASQLRGERDPFPVSIPNSEAGRCFWKVPSVSCSRAPGGRSAAGPGACPGASRPGGVPRPCRRRRCCCWEGRVGRDAGYARAGCCGG